MEMVQPMQQVSGQSPPEHRNCVTYLGASMGAVNFCFMSIVLIWRLMSFRKFRAKCYIYDSYLRNRDKGWIPFLPCKMGEIWLCSDQTCMFMMSV